MTVQELKSAFESAYGKAADAVYFSPGRVNLIGEHTDYNGGSVFPCALSFGTYLLLAKNDKEEMNFKSLNQKTIDRKGSSKPLVDTGELRNSITYEVRQK